MLPTPPSSDKASSTAPAIWWKRTEFAPPPPFFWYKLSKDLFDSNLETSRLTHNSATLAADHSYLQTCILTFPAISPPPPFLSHSSFRWTPVCDPPRSWRADCNLLPPCGWGVCVQVVNMPPLSFSPPSLFFFLFLILPRLHPPSPPSVVSPAAARMASNETEFDQVASVFLERSHLSHWPVMESASNAYINHTSFRTFSYA